MRVVLGVAGGIAAYKACSLLRLLTEGGHDVTVVPTASALHFVGEATWSALSGKKVHTDVWSDITEVPHVRIGQQADLVIVAPATADLLARAATGQADDLLTNVLLTARCPVVMAPAMHTEMWDHPATQANVATLSERGVHVVPPPSGRLTGRDTGPGRLPEPEELYAVCERELAKVSRRRPPPGRRRAATSRVAASSSPPAAPASRSTPCASSATARPASRGTPSPRPPPAAVPRSSSSPPRRCPRRRGSRSSPSRPPSSSRPPSPRPRVTPTSSSWPPRSPTSARRATRGTRSRSRHDTGPDGAADESAPVVELVRNPDVLAGLVAARGEATSPVIVGFAAETGDETGSVLDHGRAKLARKGCDLLVVNEVGVGVTFGQDTSTVHLLRRGSTDVVDVGPAPKSVVADAVWDAVTTLL